MIVPMIPYASKDGPPPRGKNIVNAYMGCMERLRHDDVAVFIDHDVMFLTPHWYPMLEIAFEERPDAGLVLCVSQHTGNPVQECGPPADPDMDAQIAFAQGRVEEYGARTEDVTEWLNGCSGAVGFLMAIRVAAWREANLDKPSGWGSQWPTGTEDGHHALCWKDFSISKGIVRSGKWRAYSLPGLYVYNHWNPEKHERGHYERDYAAECLNLGVTA